MTAGPMVVTITFESVEVKPDRTLLGDAPGNGQWATRDGPLLPSYVFYQCFVELRIPRISVRFSITCASGVATAPHAESLAQEVCATRELWTSCSNIQTTSS